MKGLRSLALIIFIGLSACSIQEQISNKVTASPSASPFSTLTPVITPNVMDLSPTPTLIPSVTPTKVIPLFPTETMLANATLEAGEKICWISGILQERIVSPTGNWTLLVCSSYSDSSPALKFVGNSGQVYSADHFNFYHWTKDEHFAYLVPLILERPVFLLDSQKGLYRINLDNGHLTYVLKPTPNIWYPLTISPDDRYLVYAINADSPEPKILESKVYLHDFISGENIEFSFDHQFVSLGNYSWSPNGGRVAFSAARKGWENNEAGFSLYILDISAKTMRVLLDSSLNRYYPIAWISNNELVLRNYDNLESYKLNITTNEFVEVTPMPTP